MLMEATSDSIPPKSTTKYAMSKVLEVRLGFKVSNLHRVSIKIIFKSSSIAATAPPMQCAEQGMDPSLGEPSMHHKPGVCDQPTQFPTNFAGASRGQGAVRKIIKKTKLNEAQAKLNFFQIALAIKYMHFKKICHRDLKNEKVLSIVNIRTM